MSRGSILCDRRCRTAIVAYTATMTSDTPSSDEMIRRAKEALALAKEDFLPKVEDEVAALGMPMSDIGVEMPMEALPSTASQRPRPNPGSAQPERARRVGSSTPDHLVIARRIPTVTTGPVPPSNFSTGSLTGSGRWMRILGSVLLGFVAVIWVLLLIGAVDNTDDLGSTIGGGIVMTFVPFLLGLILRTAGKRRATRV